MTRARRRRTVTAALEIPSTPVAAARSVPARPPRVTAASVASWAERSGRRVTRRGLSSSARISASTTIRTADQTWTTSASQRVSAAQRSQVVQCSTSGLAFRWKRRLHGSSLTFRQIAGAHRARHVIGQVGLESAAAIGHDYLPHSGNGGSAHGPRWTTLDGTPGDGPVPDGLVKCRVARHVPGTDPRRPVGRQPAQAAAAGSPASTQPPATCGPKPTCPCCGPAPGPPLNPGGPSTCTRNSTPHRPAAPTACPSCICANCSAPRSTSARGRQHSPAHPPHSRPLPLTQRRDSSAALGCPLLSPQPGSFTKLRKKSSTCRIASVKRSRLTGLVMYALACNW